MLHACLELRERLLSNGLIARERVRHTARVAAALHVVLAPQGRDAGARPTKLPSDQREIEQPVGICSPHGVLGYSHAPDEARTAEWRARIDSGSLSNVLGGDAGDLLGIFKIVLLDGAPPLIVAFCPVGDEGGVGEPFVHDYFGHCVQQSNICARTRPEPQVSVVAHVDAARVDDDQLRASFNHRAPHPGRGNRVVRVRVRANDDQASGLFVVDV